MRLSPVRYFLFMLPLCLWLCIAAKAQTSQPVAPSVPIASSLRSWDGPISKEMIAARIQALQSRLEELDKSGLAQDDLEATRVAFQQQISLLRSLDDLLGKQQAYVQQLQELPQRLAILHAERSKIEDSAPASFPAVSEQLREQVEKQLHGARTEIETLSKQLASAELRLATIAKELEQLQTERGQLEQMVLAERSAAPQVVKSSPLISARAELTQLKLQLARVKAATLEAERQWLTQQGPLQDALLGMAKGRLRILKRNLDKIKQALGQAIRQEQVDLTTTAIGIEQRLKKTADPAEEVVLAVELETVEIRKLTSRYRQQLNRVSDRVLVQEKFNSQEKQDLDRLVSLVERYAGGEHVAQRLQLAFARLRRERTLFRADLIGELEGRLQMLTEPSLDVDEQLYEFDRVGELRIGEMRVQLDIVDRAEVEAKVAQVRQALGEQKLALRELHQSLALLTQELNKLINLHRERKRLLDDSYRFILTKMFGFRDSQPMSWHVFYAAAAGVLHTADRLRRFVRTELSIVVAGLLRSTRFWLLLPLLFIGLPWVAYRIRHALRSWARSYASDEVERQSFIRTALSASLMLIQTSIWPTYIAVIVWAWPQILPGGAYESEFKRALIAGIQLAALLLWLGLLGHAIFRRQGWGQRFAGLRPELCDFLRRTIMVGWLAALVLLVPRHLLLTATSGSEFIRENLALARVLFMTFQTLMLVLIGITCRRGSRLMQSVFANSRQRHGLLWRNWPLAHVAILAGIVAVVALDFQGYRYAARALWLRTGEALLVVLLLMMLRGLLNGIIDRLVWQRQPPGDRPVDPAQPSRWSLLQQGRQFVHFILVLVGFVIIQHLYGLDQDILSILESVRLFSIGKNTTGQLLWLTLGDVLVVVLIFSGLGLLVRNLPGLYEIVLFPRVRWEAGFRYAFLTLSRYALVLIALWWSLTLLHLRWSNIQWILAAASVGLGFGLQEIVGNFVSGLILLIERPISVGDFVAVGGQEGTITRITIRATTIQNLDNQTVIIPNKEFVAGKVTNWTLGDPYVRVVASVGVAYGSDMELVKRLLTEVVSNHPKVLRYPSPQVLFIGFGDSSLDWEVWFFVPSPRDRFAITNDVLLYIDQAFREHDVHIPFPQRDLHLRSAEAAVILHANNNSHPSETSIPTSEPVPSERAE